MTLLLARIAQAHRSIAPSVSVISGLHLDGADNSTVFTDISGKAWTRIGSSSSLKTATKKFGTASLYVGTPAYYSAYGIKTAGHAGFNFGTAEFSISFWIYITSTTGYQNVLDLNSNSSVNKTGAILIQTGNGDGKPSVYVNGGAIISAPSIAFPVGSWQFCEVTRDKVGHDKLYLYQGGILSGSADLAGASIGGSAFPVAWGAYANGNFSIGGYIDDPLITKGVCSHRGGTTYTPPTAAFA